MTDFPYSPVSEAVNAVMRVAIATELLAHGEFSSMGNGYPNALLAADEVIKIIRSFDFAQTPIEAALRDAFPHFQDDAPITPEAIKGIGKEYLEMVMGWEPQKTEIEFADDDGNIRKIVYEPGEYESGSFPGWVLADDTISNTSTDRPAPAQKQLDWLRWGLEEIVRCTEPRAGNGDRFICGIACEALAAAGFDLGAAGIQKPTVKVSSADHKSDRINSTIPCYRGGHKCSWPACSADCDGRPGVAQSSPDRASKP